MLVFVIYNMRMLYVTHVCVTWVYYMHLCVSHSCIYALYICVCVYNRASVSVEEREACLLYFSSYLPGNLGFSSEFTFVFHAWGANSFDINCLNRLKLITDVFYSENYFECACAVFLITHQIGSRLEESLSRIDVLLLRSTLHTFNACNGARKQLVKTLKREKNVISELSASYLKVFKVKY